MSETTPNRTPYRTRLDVLFAAEARRAVIIRRGPKRHFHLIEWDLDTDTFTSGQWMKGVISPCDLSPDGRYLIYFAAQYHRDNHEVRGRIERVDGLEPGYDPLRASYKLALKSKRAKHRKVPRYMRSAIDGPRLPPRENTGTWTAISPVPYFSALAIWPAFGTWTGGGVFLRNNRIAIYESPDGMTPIELVNMPAKVKISQASACFRPAPNAYRPYKKESPLHTKLCAAIVACGAEWVDWVSVHDGPDMLFGADGRLWRLENWQRFDEANYLKRADLLGDFRDMSFEMIAPPRDAMRW